MFRLNRLTDYAVVVLCQLARHEGRAMTAPQISQDTILPLPTVSKILNALSKADLVVAQRGAAGGYSLSRAAEDIKVSEIIQALEGPIALTACVEGSADGCEVEAICPMSGHWNKINAAVRHALDQVSLAEIIGPPLAPFAAPEQAETRLAR